MDANEFEIKPVSARHLRCGRDFAASYAGEHIAGTEFVIGALFVSWGASARDIIFGLLLGNLLAVLSWRFITGPIAVDTRLTLYAYLEKIAGPIVTKVYSFVNGILFCILAGAMITVSASAVRVLFDIDPQVTWYPSDFRFVLVATGVGIVVVAVAVQGFARVARFARMCAPWMIAMFLAGAIAALPILIQATVEVDAVASVEDFFNLAETSIWTGTNAAIGFWHIAAFAWIANLAMHGGLGDLSLLRFARNANYGYFSGLGMFIGHYVAWIAAGIMGAAAATQLTVPISELDAGEIAFRSLGTAGILAVVIAGWTTSNPTIYRAGLAFQSLNRNWSRRSVTIVAGLLTTVIACFPFVFTKLLGFVGVMGLMLAPIGAIVVVEHWVFPKLALTRYWSSYKNERINLAALSSWLLTLGFGAFLHQWAGVHLFFLLVPSWLFATVIYTVMAFMLGAREAYPDTAIAERAERQRKQLERDYLMGLSTDRLSQSGRRKSDVSIIARLLWLGSLSACLVLAGYAYATGDIDGFRGWVIVPTLFYFATVIATVFRTEGINR